MQLLQDVLTHCQYIVDDTKDISLDRFITSRQIQQVVERNLEIIGIAAMRIRAEAPDVFDQMYELRNSISLRNRLAHGYDDDISYEIIWETARVSIPNLIDEVHEQLN